MINSLKPFVRRQLKHIRRYRVRLDQDAILDALHRFGRFRGSALMVHSSLSGCGHIAGGAATVIDALCQWIEGRNLVLPTHTYCYPDSHGNVPVYDARSTPSVVGAITNEFWRRPDVGRSIHPTHSLAASGPDAEAICGGHASCDTPCGKGTPYERLIQQDCAVLMFGVTMNTYTFFHTAEDSAALPFLYDEEPYELLYRGVDDRVHVLNMWRHNMGIARRFAKTDDWLEARGLLVRQRLKLGEVLYLPHAADVHHAVVEELTRNPFFLVDEQARKPLAERFGIKS